MTPLLLASVYKLKMETNNLNLVSAHDVLDSEINLEFMSLDIDSPNKDNKENM